MLTTVIIITSFIILLIDIIGSNRSDDRPKYLLKLTTKGLILLVVAIVGVVSSAGKEYLEYRDQKRQTEIENHKLLVVARRADHTISYPMMFLSGFLSGENKKKIFKLFNTDFQDEIGKDRPDPFILDPLVIIFAKYPWFTESNMERNGEKVHWLGNLGWHLLRLDDECESFLKHYGNIKHPLVDAIDNIRIRNETLLFMIDCCLGRSEYQNQFIDLYRNGIPEVHIEFYRHFFLQVLKAKRLIRETKRGKKKLTH